MFPKVSFLSHYKLKKIYNQTDKLLHSKGNYKKKKEEKISNRMKEKIYMIIFIDTEKVFEETYTIHDK